VIKSFCAQGGDFTRRNGSGGESIYGATFPDESFARKHTVEGLLSMANRGANTQSSQFFITTRPTPHLDGKHVVFGRVVHGYDIVQRIEKEPVDERSKPLSTVMVANCGELELRLPPAQGKVTYNGVSKHVNFFTFFLFSASTRKETISICIIR
jgi:peptidyl-prolyl isomerase G (cyclophilin G)